MRIILKSIKLLNFKGVRDLNINFNEEGATSICGKNAIGKTTIFDAFTWLMFGKDSTDRKDFNIKTIDGAGNVIEKLPHEVSATIIVDGEEMNLRKCYDEKWTKKRGTTVEEFTGNEVHPFINDVPYSVSEYQRKVNDICNESIFKLITNPLYMPSMKKDAQRQTLFDMAGELSDKDVAAGNKDFVALLDSLTGKTLEEYKRQIAAAKTRIKKELIDIPGRIDERKRSVNSIPVENWDVLNTELIKTQEKIKNIDTQIADQSKSYESASKARIEIVKEISAKKVELEKVKNNIENELLADYRNKSNKRKSLIIKLGQFQGDEKTINNCIEEIKESISKLQKKREELVANWYEINAEQIQFNDDQFVCPTCKRPLDNEDIEKQKKSMTEAFNEDKADRLLANQNKGLSVKAKIETNKRALEGYEHQLEVVQKEIGEILFDDLYTNEPEKPETSSVIPSDKRYIAACTAISSLEKQIEGELTALDNQELKGQKETLQQQCRELEERLSKKGIIEDNNRRIKELEEQQRTLSQELSENEGIEFTIESFSKAKVEMVEQRINNMFAVVRWKMFEKQINGGEVPTCEAMVNGVPFSDVNKADQINAGLDIINAICQYNNVYAPIFVDNAESVNNLLSTSSQVIRLVVSNDNQLIIQ